MAVKALVHIEHIGAAITPGNVLVDVSFVALAGPTVDSGLQVEADGAGVQTAVKDAVKAALTNDHGYTFAAEDVVKLTSEA